MEFDIYAPVYDANLPRWRQGEDHAAIAATQEAEDRRAALYREALVAHFAESPEARAIQARGGRLRWADLLLEFAAMYQRRTPPALEPEDLDEIVRDIIPQKVAVAPQAAPVIIEELSAFWRFLGRTFDLPNAAACLDWLADPAVLADLEEALASPRNYGLFKTIVMQGLARGYDVSTNAGIDAWIDVYNAELGAGPNPARVPPRDAQGQRGTPPSPPPPPPNRPSRKRRR